MAPTGDHHHHHYHHHHHQHHYIIIIIIIIISSSSSLYHHHHRSEIWHLQEISIVVVVDQNFQPLDLVNVFFHLEQ